ncbi:MAG TPA: glycosyltransferase family 2 protein [Williamwhitmania sp.]|nr:glycosyltransferase family 2 protein [Williamwhitmania sp.]
MNRKSIIILVNYNNACDTIDCINSIKKSDNTDYCIVVVDNNSLDDSYVKFADYTNRNDVDNKYNDLLNINRSYNLLVSNNLLFIKTPINLGFAGGNNFGVRFVKNIGLNFEYVWFLNNDTIIEVNTLGYLVERMEYERINNSRLGILGCKLFRYYQPDRFQGVGGMYNKYTATCSQLGDGEFDEGQYDVQDVIFNYPIGASLFVSCDFIEKVGLMEESYFLYFEELDWVMRGKQYDFRFGYEYKARVFHKEGGSTKSSVKRLSLIADQCQVRNRIIFTYRYYPQYLISVIPFTFGSVLNRFLRGQFKRAIELLLVIFKTSFGILFRCYE